MAVKKEVRVRAKGEELEATATRRSADTTPGRAEPAGQLLILGLQASAGNRAVTELLSRPHARPFAVQRCGPEYPGCDCDHRAVVDVQRARNDVVDEFGTLEVNDSWMAAPPAEQVSSRLSVPAGTGPTQIEVAEDEEESGPGWMNGDDLIAGNEGGEAEQEEESASPTGGTYRSGASASLAAGACADTTGTIPAWVGAYVECVGKKSYRAEVRASEPAAVRPCELVHERKHITDWNADAYYKSTNYCKDCPDGRIVYYKNNADRKKFECAAIAVETACLTKAMAKEKDASKKATMKNRVDVTLPAYATTVGGCP